MPNLRRSIVGPLDELGPAFEGRRGVYLQASDGREVVVLRGQLRQRFLEETGTRAQRRQKAWQWLRERIRDALGEEQVGAEAVSGDFDDADGEVASLEVS